MQAHPGFVEDGEMQLFEVRSLYMNCFADVKSYIAYYGVDLENKALVSKTSLADFYADGSVKTTGGLSLSVIQNMVINGEPALEIRERGLTYDGKTNDNYRILIEKGRVYDIELGQTPYEKLSPTVKKVIGTIVLP